MPTVSVVIPTYNRAGVLPRAIDSVLNQTVDDLELIIVDDGSTDHTIPVIEAYNDPRVRVVSHESNRGASAARNTGIDNANGQYVAFLDSDDEWKAEKLERQLDLLSERSDDWVAAYCGFEIHSSGLTGTVIKNAAAVLSHGASLGPREGGEELLGEILSDNLQPGGGSTLLVGTDVAKQVGGFDESLARFQDPEFVLRILEVGKLAYADEPLVIRHDSGSPDAALVEQADEQYLEMYADTINRLESNGYDVTGRHNLVLSKAYLQEGNYARGLSLLRKAAVHPRHTPGIIWSGTFGMRARPKRALILGGVALFVLVLVLVYHRR